MRSRSSTTTSAGGRAVTRRSFLQWLIACVLITGLMPWAMLSAAAQDGTPAAGAAQVVGELPDISVAETTGGTLNMGISFDATNFDPAQTQDNMSLWVEMKCSAAWCGSITSALTSRATWPSRGTSRTMARNTPSTFGPTPCSATAPRSLPTTSSFPSNAPCADESLIGWTFEAMESVEAVDPATVKITLTAPAAPFANDMALWGASIVSKAAAEAPGTASACSRWAAGRSCSTRGRRASRSPS